MTEPFLGYSPSQPRNKDGEWTRGGGASGKSKPSGGGSGKSDSGGGGVPRPSQAHIDKVRELSRAALGNRKDEERIVGVLKDYVEQSEVSVRVPSKVLGSILNDGLKNQHETGKSAGALVNRSLRKDAEQTMFGLPKSSKPSDYPIYGYMELKKGGPHPGVAQYGDARITLKESVKDRASFTVSDSLLTGAKGRVLPTPMRSPGIEAVGAGVWGKKLAGVKTPAQAMQQIPYMEVQVHGGVKARDIARVDFAKTPSPEIQAKLKSAGITWGML